jgi:hypothetical protein
LLGNRNDADFAKHTEMLRYRRLRYPKNLGDLPHSAPPAIYKDVDNFSPARFGDGIENVGGRGCAGHLGKVYSHMGICQVDFCKLRKEAQTGA